MQTMGFKARARRYTNPDPTRYRKRIGFRERRRARRIRAALLRRLATKHETKD